MTAAVQPLLAWRAWRVIPWEEDGGRKSYRLAPLWQGRPWPSCQPVRAECHGLRAGAHDAPQEHHTCGVWALRSPARVQRTVDACDGLEVSAIGRVSLWGKVVEQELGYRAQFAYPYSVLVHAPEREVADAIRAAYKIDVDWIRSAAEVPEEPAADVDVPELSAADGLRGVLLGCLYERERTCTVYEIQSRLEDDGTIPMPSGRRFSAKGSGAAIARGMKRLEDQGLIERGYARAYEKGPTRLHRLTDAGIVEARRLLRPRTQIKATYRHGRAETLTVTAALRRIAAMPEVLFAPEIQQERDTWTPKRLAAKRKGRRHYREWLEERRQTVRGRAGLY